jgi:hypothetical protein
MIRLKAPSSLLRKGSASSVLALLMLLTVVTRSASAPLNYADPNKRSLVVDVRSEVLETLQPQNDSKIQPTLECFKRALVEIGRWRVENPCRIDWLKISENGTGKEAAFGCGRILYSYRRDLFRPVVVLHGRFVEGPRQNASALLSSQEIARPVDESPFFRLSHGEASIEPMRLYGFVTRLYGLIQLTFKRSSTSQKICDTVSRGIVP